METMKFFPNNVYNNAYYKEIHISEVRPGMTIYHNDQFATVGKNDITKDKFMGLSVFGDTYKVGTRPIVMILFKVPTAFGVVFR